MRIVICIAAYVALWVLASYIGRALDQYDESRNLRS